jgi:hypothetical protein
VPRPPLFQRRLWLLPGDLRHGREVRYERGGPRDYHDFTACIVRRHLRNPLFDNPESGQSRNYSGHQPSEDPLASDMNSHVSRDPHEASTHLVREGRIRFVDGAKW